MTAKQKAEHMLSTYTTLFGAARAQDKALKEVGHHLVHNPGSQYWQDVKIAIEQHGKKMDDKGH